MFAGRWWLFVSALTIIPAFHGQVVHSRGLLEQGSSDTGAAAAHDAVALPTALRHDGHGSGGDDDDNSTLPESCDGASAYGKQTEVGPDGATTTTVVRYASKDHSNVTLLFNVRSDSDIQDSEGSGPTFDFYLNQTMELAGMGGGGGGGGGGGESNGTGGGGGGGGGGLGINGVLNVTYVLNVDARTTIRNSTNSGPRFTFHINSLPPNYDQQQQDANQSQYTNDSHAAQPTAVMATLEAEPRGGFPAEQL